MDRFANDLRMACGGLCFRPATQPAATSLLATLGPLRAISSWSNNLSRPLLRIATWPKAYRAPNAVRAICVCVLSYQSRISDWGTSFVVLGAWNGDFSPRTTDLRSRTPILGAGRDAIAIAGCIVTPPQHRHAGSLHASAPQAGGHPTWPLSRWAGRRRRITLRPPATIYL